jgi:CrcB protein
MRFVWIGLGGCAGALLRYWIGGLVQNRAAGSFPWGTLAVNLIGCFAIGVLMALVADRPLVGPNVRSFAGIGLLGAFTTFSTFGYETVALIETGSWLLAMSNVLVSVTGGLLMVFCGRWLALWVL